eukprot:4124953-Prymnesium_polylepis.1
MALFGASRSRPGPHVPLKLWAEQTMGDDKEVVRGALVVREAPRREPAAEEDGARNKSAERVRLLVEHRAERGGLPELPGEGAVDKVEADETHAEQQQLARRELVAAGTEQRRMLGSAT